MNKTFKILHNDNHDDGLILRINGTIGEKVTITFIFHKSYSSQLKGTTEISIINIYVISSLNFRLDC